MRSAPEERHLTQLWLLDADLAIFSGFSARKAASIKDDSREKGLHLPKTIRKLRRNRSIVMEQPPITFLPSIRLLNPKLFAKVFTNERMGIKIARIVRIFSG
jgi:hypothetical protein